MYERLSAGDAGEGGAVPAKRCGATFEAIIRSFPGRVLTVTVLCARKRPLSFDSCAPAPAAKRARGGDAAAAAPSAGPAHNNNGQGGDHQELVERARLMPRDSAASVLSLHSLAAAPVGAKRAPSSPVRVGQPLLPSLMSAPAAQRPSGALGRACSL
eukprot:Tamp_28194.p3 GENE.Tamp_28194~~Tamp_28194.p3  ORF type:complete len:183 (+),score=26.48 Tamp_28194:81-551(+)